MIDRDSIYEVVVIDDNIIDLIINSKVVQLVNVGKTIFKNDSAEDVLINLNERIIGGLKAPDLILLDIMMPLVTGLDFLDQIDKMPAEFIEGLKIVMVTSSLDPGDYSLAMSHKNVIAFLGKPLTPQKLESVFLDDFG